MRQEQQDVQKAMQNQGLKSTLHRTENWKEPRRKRGRDTAGTERKSQAVQAEAVSLKLSYFLWSISGTKEMVILFRRSLGWSWVKFSRLEENYILLSTPGTVLGMLVSPRTSCAFLPAHIPGGPVPCLHRFLQEILFELG